MEDEFEFDKEILVAFDFDGTFTQMDTYNKPPVINLKAIRYFHKINKLNVKTILFSCRHGQHLQQAIDLLQDYDVYFDYINTDNGKRNSGIKVNADVYIDDRANDGKIRWFKTYKHIKRLIKCNNKK